MSAEFTDYERAAAAAAEGRRKRAQACAEAWALCKRARKALDHENIRANELDGEWYLVTSGTGERIDFAYDVDTVADLGDKLDGKITYEDWCDLVKVVEDRRVAVDYYLAGNGNLGRCGSCQPVLTDEQRLVLDDAIKIRNL